MTEKHKTIYLKDYQPPDYLVDSVDLHFELGEETTLVSSRLRMRAYTGIGSEKPLVLDGRDLVLKSLTLNGIPLQPGEFDTDDESLTIRSVPGAFTLEMETEIKPQDNTSLEGLYISGGNFCTQCEAEGFRKITYFPDRPDVMASYTTTIVADRRRYPVLLSNGNLIRTGDLEDGRHFAVWQDPFRKPSYLFALVAGDLEAVEDTFTTMSGRSVSLRFYVQSHNVSKCGHAVASLKKAMRWDEEVFGREYDLDVYMVFAADDFNFGAMENKGLNIFNSKYVLASPATATDADYLGIEAVIGHEYFHNWTGNRITCRDWFQLSMKEGLTIFRDQEFSSDMQSRGLERIGNIKILRTRQFPEDAGPLAHPVRPESYIEISNFYTMTVYYKGAEIVRMMHTLLGREGFRRGMDRFFEVHDGQAVTVDDFVRAMEEANGADLAQFRLWYCRAGTPQLKVAWSHDRASSTLTLEIEQELSPASTNPQPLHIPFAVGLLGRSGFELPLQLSGEEAPAPGGTRVLELRKEKELFTFVGIPEPPVPSLLRGFTAPVKMSAPYTEKDLIFIIANDPDSFTSWDAAQRLYADLILKLARDFRQGVAMQLEGNLVEAFARVLTDGAPRDPLFRAELLTLPGESYLAELMEVVDVEGLHEARLFVCRKLASLLRDTFLSVYSNNADPGPYRIDIAAMGRRALKNLSLSYLMTLEDPEIAKISYRQFSESGNMTDVVAALGPLANVQFPEREKALGEFYQKWQDDPLVMDKWFSLQALSYLPRTLDAVEALLLHPAFEIRNPNRARALIGSFCNSNPFRFHDISGRGYRFLGDQVVKLNSLNPQLASRLLEPLTVWRRYDETRQSLMKSKLERVLQLPDLARDLYEITKKSLEA